MRRARASLQSASDLMQTSCHMQLCGSVHLYDFTCFLGMCAFLTKRDFSDPEMFKWRGRASTKKKESQKVTLIFSLI